MPGTFRFANSLVVFLKKIFNEGIRLHNLKYIVLLYYNYVVETFPVVFLKEIFNERIR